MDFDGLYRTYYMSVYSYVMTIVKSAHLAEEITQQTFYKALRNMDQFEGKSGQLTWICAIAKNAAFDELKRQSRFRAEASVGESSILPVLEGPGSRAQGSMERQSQESVERQAEDEAAVLRIHQLLHEMAEPYKEVFQLRVFGELSFAKIGVIFGKTENWARVTYHRAKWKLQERMDDNE
ncbi:MAG: RNA polymerase sigma factor [Clostridium sp.]|nr:RNA polymerase sigma factor [Clostridium sp.]